MVLDPIPQSLPVHFFGSRPQPPTSPPCHMNDVNTYMNEMNLKFQYPYNDMHIRMNDMNLVWMM